MWNVRRYADQTTRRSSGTGGRVKQRREEDSNFPSRHQPNGPMDKFDN